MIRQLIYWVARLLSLLTLGLTLFISWLLFTTAGAYWLVEQVPGLTVKGVQGQLVSSLQVEQVQWHNKNLSLTLDKLNFNWQPRCLLEAKFCITSLQLGALNLVTSEVAEPLEAKSFDWSKLRLPALELPKLDLQALTYLKELTLEQFGLDYFELNGQEQLSNLALTIDWQATHINLTKLELQSPWLATRLEKNSPQAAKVQLKGWLLTEKNWPLDLSLTSELSGLPLELLLAGDFQKLRLEASLKTSTQVQNTRETPPFIKLAGWVNVLDTSAPLDLVLAWHKLKPSKVYPQLTGWPKDLTLKKGKLTLKGDLQAGWQLEAVTEQALNELPLNLNLSSNISWDKLTLDNLQLNLGTASWLALELELSKITTQRFELRGQLAGQLMTQLADKTDLASEFSGFLATASSKGGAPDYQLSLAKFNIITGQEKLALNLDLNPQEWRSSLDLEVKDFTTLIQASVQLVTDSFSELLPNQLAIQLETLLTQHQLAGDLQLASNLLIPALPLNKQLTHHQILQNLSQGDYQLDLAANHLSYNDLNLSHTNLALGYAGLKNNQDPELSLALTSQEVTLGNKNQQQEAQLIQAAKVKLAGVLSKHQLTAGFILDKQPLEMGVQGGVQLISLDNLSWHYQLATLTSELIKPWLPADLRWTDQLNGKLKGQWKNQQVEVDLQLTSGPGELAVRLEDTLNKTFSWVPLNYQLLNLGLTLESEQLKVHFKLDGEALGYLNTQVSLALYPDPNSQQRSIQGSYQLKGLQLQLLSPFIEIDQVAGQLVGEGEILGHLLAPELWGNLQLEKVVLADTRWPISLQRLDGELLFKGEQVDLLADFSTGEGGEGKLQGEVSWQPELIARLHLSGEAFNVRVEPWASLLVTPDLTFSYQQQALLLAGQVKVPSGLISVQQLPKQAIKVSEDAQVLGREVVAAKGSKLDLNIELLLGNANQPDKPPLGLEALGLNAELQGRLRVTQALQTRGELLLVKGTYQSWGQDLKLRKARLTFAGPYSLPYLDIEAVREVQELVVGIHMTGRVDRPEAEIFSEPTMANEQALSWLILGRPLRTESDENALNAAAISYGLKQASGVTQRLGETLGLKDFELIAEGGGSETSVVASGHINDRLSVRYGVGVYDEISRFVVRYELSRKVYIEAASALASSLDIFWRLEF